MNQETKTLLAPARVPGRKVGAGHCLPNRAWTHGLRLRGDCLRKLVCDVFEGVSAHDPIDVEEGFDLATDFCHAEEVTGVDARAEFRGRFNLLPRQIDDLPSYLKTDSSHELCGVR